MLAFTSGAFTREGAARQNLSEQTSIHTSYIPSSGMPPSLSCWLVRNHTNRTIFLFLAVNSHEGCTALQECGRNCAFLCGCRCGRGAALQGIAAAIDRSNHWHRSRDSYHFFRFRRCPLSLGDLLLAGLLCLCDFKCIPLGDGQLSTRPNHCACSLRLCSCPDFTCFPKAPPSGQTIGWARCVRDVAE